MHLNQYIWVLALTLVSPTRVSAAEFTIPHTFVPNAAAKAAEVNANFTAVKQGLQDLQNQLPGHGGSPTTPATSCADMHSKVAAAASGVYWVKPTISSIAFRVYCEMTTDGGGWTLVWSNLRGGRGKVTTELPWGAAINTLPRVRGELSADLESFEVYTGLKHWAGLSPGGLLRYDWAKGYRKDIDNGSTIDQSYRCPYTLDSALNYRISFLTASCAHLVGAVEPGLVLGNNGDQFTTYDQDHDTPAHQRKLLRTVRSCTPKHLGGTGIVGAEVLTGVAKMKATVISTAPTGLAQLRVGVMTPAPLPVSAPGTAGFMSSNDTGENYVV